MISVGYAYADGIAALNAFLQNKNSTLSANFSQTVFGSKKNKTSNGVMEISRPNKFRWQYNEEGQIIISDGEKIYIYDKPLQQVTEKKLDNSLGKSPALLLAGGSEIKKYYTVTAQPDSEGLEWISLMPKTVEDNNGFKVVQIGFTKTTQKLAQMKFIDSFNNKSIISFSQVKTGIRVPDSTFKFIPAKGVDIIQADS
jgi:NAD+ synthase (glutamine-hydrolysing)/outer membrane lipoprotein carrier protein